MTLREFIDVCDSGYFPVSVHYYARRIAQFPFEIKECVRLEDFPEAVDCDEMLDVEILGIMITKTGDGSLRWVISVKVR